MTPKTTAEQTAMTITGVTTLRRAGREERARTRRERRRATVDRRGREERRCAVLATCTAAGDRSAASSSTTVAYRRSGSFSRHFRTMASRPGGSPGTIGPSGGGGSDTCAMIVARSVARSNGGRPVSIA